MAHLANSQSLSALRGSQVGPEMGPTSSSLFGGIEFYAQIGSLPAYGHLNPLSATTGTLGRDVGVDSMNGAGFSGRLVRDGMVLTCADEQQVGFGVTVFPGRLKTETDAYIIHDAGDADFDPFAELSIDDIWYVHAFMGVPLGAGYYVDFVVGFQGISFVIDARHFIFFVSHITSIERDGEYDGLPLYMIHREVVQIELFHSTSGESGDLDEDYLPTFSRHISADALGENVVLGAEDHLFTFNWDGGLSLRSSTMITPDTVLDSSWAGCRHVAAGFDTVGVVEEWQTLDTSYTVPIASSVSKILVPYPGSPGQYTEAVNPNYSSDLATMEAYAVSTIIGYHQSNFKVFDRDLDLQSTTSLFSTVAHPAVVFRDFSDNYSEGGTNLPKTMNYTQATWSTGADYLETDLFNTTLFDAGGVHPDDFPTPVIGRYDQTNNNYKIFYLFGGGPNNATLDEFAYRALRVDPTAGVTATYGTLVMSAFVRVGSPGFGMASLGGTFYVSTIILSPLPDTQVWLFDDDLNRTQEISTITLGGPGVPGQVALFGGGGSGGVSTGAVSSSNLVQRKAVNRS